MENDTLYIMCCKAYKKENRPALERSILKAGLGGDGPAMRIEKTPSKKPFLKGERACISISHSENMFILALYGSAVGADVQKHRHESFAAVAQRFFTPAQSARVREDPRTFYEIFTRYEALAKLKDVPLARLMNGKSSKAQSISGENIFFRTFENEKEGYTLSLAFKQKPAKIQWMYFDGDAKPLQKEQEA